MKSVIIIGAGPAGCYAAYLFAKNGYNVSLYEEDKEIGKPVQCTGLLTADIKEFIPDIDTAPYMQKIITSLNVHSYGSFCTIPTHEYVVNRTTFDQHLSKMAQNAGATIYTKHRFIESNENGIIIKDIVNNRTVSLSCDILIGADGPRSKVRSTFFPHSRLECFSAIQPVMNYTAQNDSFDVYLGEKFHGFFGWRVPEGNNLHRVGMAAVPGKKVSVAPLHEKVGKQSVSHHEGGLIPLFNPKMQIYRQHKYSTKEKNNSSKEKNKGYQKICYVFLLGDAAGQVKATTGGGIISGMQGATLLYSCVNKTKYHQYKPSLYYRLYRNLWLHLLIHKSLLYFKKKDYISLIRQFRNAKNTAILTKVSREQPIKLLLLLMLNNLSLVRFIPKALLGLFSMTKTTSRNI